MRSSGVGSVRWWAYPILLAGVALGFDAADRRVPFSLLGSGLLDEVAHLATGALGLLVLACLIDVPRRFYVAGLIASVAIDLDHIPLYLGLGDKDQRPVTHSLLTVLVVAGATAVSRRHRAVLAGVVTGLLIHFARDIAEGPPGVRMLWPLQDTAWTAGFWWFLGMIIAFTAARLVLASAGIPRRRARLFWTPPASGSLADAPIGRVTSGDRLPDSEPEEPDLESASGARLLPAGAFGGRRVWRRGQGAGPGARALAGWNRTQLVVNARPPPICLHGWARIASRRRRPE